MRHGKHAVGKAGKMLSLFRINSLLLSGRDVSRPYTNAYKVKIDVGMASMPSAKKFISSSNAICASFFPHIVVPPLLHETAS